MEQKLDDEALTRMKELVAEYERESSQSDHSDNSQRVRQTYLRQFMRWLEGKASPLDYDGELTPE